MTPMKSIWHPIYMLVLALLAGKTASAQDSTFAFANKLDGITAVKDYSRSYKLTAATKVFHALIEARGNFSIIRPGLQLTASEQQVAYLDPVAKIIGIEEKAYDICASFGADSLNALAALLSHELMHYYQRHRLTGISGNESSVIQEVEADYLGGFLAHLAGYNTLPVLPGLLKKLYSEYPLQEDMAGYPTLAERIDLTAQAAGRFDALLYRFQLANFLTITGRYEDAIVYYTMLADSFPGREIYNNLGVLYTLWELQKNPFTLNIMLPLELDPVSRLEHSKNVPLPEAYATSPLLQTALGYFRQAAVLDGRYLPALINEACVLALMGNSEAAGEMADKAQKLASKLDSKKARADVLVLQGIVAYLGNSADAPGAAAKSWEAAQQMGSTTARYNLSVLQKSAAGAMRPKEQYDPSRKEMIEDWNLDWDITRFQDDLQIWYLPAPWQDWRFGLMDTPLKASRMLLHYKDADHYSLFQYTGSNYSGTTAKGIQTGSKRTEVELKYGQPSVTMDTPAGQYWLYTKAQIIFEFREDMVLRWIVFHQ